MSNEKFPMIRQGLVNYIGSMNSALQTKDENLKRQQIVAIILEETLKFANKDDYVLKPVLRATRKILASRYNDLLKLGIKDQDTINNYITAIDLLDQICK